MKKETTKVKPGKVYGYIRASKHEQEHTLLAQDDQIVAHYHKVMKEKGYAWGGLLTDPGVKSRVELARRPQGSKLVMALQPGDAVVMTKMDRAFRDVEEFLSTAKDWDHRGISLILLECGDIGVLDSRSAYGRAMVTMRALFAQLERDLISDRNKEVAAALKNRGRPAGGNIAPYGLQYVSTGRNNAGGKLIRRYAKHPRSREIGALICQLLDRGHSLDGILASFHDKGVVNLQTGLPYSRNTLWAHSQQERKLRAAEAELQPGERVFLVCPSRGEVRKIPMGPEAKKE